jgi:hypothetical protein
MNVIKPENDALVTLPVVRESLGINPCKVTILLDKAYELGEKSL